MVVKNPSTIMPLPTSDN